MTAVECVVKPAATVALGSMPKRIPPAMSAATVRGFQ